ncbi:glucosamine-6-phosphate deaminase [Candidatus Neomarinimicrobiota bacterium]
MGRYVQFEDELIPVIEFESLPQMGQGIALRFIEWVQQNPESVVCLPTGRTPEYFIRWMNHIIEHWDTEEVAHLRDEFYLSPDKPVFSGLTFVQMDEFFPITADHPNSFIAFVRRYYLKPFGFEESRALLMDFDSLPWPQGLSVVDIFPDQTIDLTLRSRMPSNDAEELQRQAIMILDSFAQEYEQHIRELGGIGFFLGGIGPDGHIAFNIRGSNFFSVTRLIHTNFETQAAAATDLGGIEISSGKAAMTIGLGTIALRPDAAVIIMAAGEAKARVIAEAVIKSASIENPASSLQLLSGARMYLTRGATIKLFQRRLDRFIQNSAEQQENMVRALIDLSVRTEVPLLELTAAGMQTDPFCNHLLQRDGWTYENLREFVYDIVTSRLEAGLEEFENKRFLHTGPHHDDILLGYLPAIIHQVRPASNHHEFAIMTSGFTAVSNIFIEQSAAMTLDYLQTWQFRRTWQEGYFERPPEDLRNQDVKDYLDAEAARNRHASDRCIARKVVRTVMEIYSMDNPTDIRRILEQIISEVHSQYPGAKDERTTQILKGTMREFEEDLAWAHYGFRSQQIHHLRLAFYQGDYFTDDPTREKDLPPIRELFSRVNPHIITLAFDPEGTGPDTHYKVLQAIATSMKELPPDHREGKQIWGYRNAWHRFHPAEANIYVPVTINSMATLDHIFKTCYLTQRKASFPSHEHHGPFSELIQSIFVEQFKTLSIALGSNYWLEHTSPRIRATHGILFIKCMSVDQLLSAASILRESIGHV